MGDEDIPLMGGKDVPLRLQFKAVLRFAVSDSAGFLSVIGALVSCILSFFFKFSPYRNIYVSLMFLFLFLQYLFLFYFLFLYWCYGLHTSKIDVFTYVFGEGAKEEVMEIYRREISDKGKEKIVSFCKKFTVMLAILTPLFEFLIVPRFYPELVTSVEESSIPILYALITLCLTFSPLLILLCLSFPLESYLKAYNEWAQSRGIEYLKRRGIKPISRTLEIIALIIVVLLIGLTGIILLVI